MQLSIPSDSPTDRCLMWLSALRASTSVARGAASLQLVVDGASLSSPAIIAKALCGPSLVGASPAAEASTTHWLGVLFSSPAAALPAALSAALTSTSYVAGHTFTVADAVAWFLLTPAGVAAGGPSTARWAAQLAVEPSAAPFWVAAGAPTPPLARPPSPLRLFTTGPAPVTAPVTPAPSSSPAGAAGDAAPGGKPKGKDKEGKPKAAPAPAPPAAELDPIASVDFRVGVILKAWPHPESDKLWCESIDLGEGEPRQIGSGLRAYFTEAQMTGQRVVVWANLLPRKLAGFPSNGMVLCATGADGTVEFVEPPPGAVVGERVSFGPSHAGEALPAKKADKLKLADLVFPGLATTAEGVAAWNGVPFGTSAGVCTVKSVKGAPIK